MYSRCRDDVVGRWRVGSSEEQPQAGKRGCLARFFKARSRKAVIAGWLM